MKNIIKDRKTEISIVDEIHKSSVVLTALDFFVQFVVVKASAYVPVSR